MPSENDKQGASAPGSGGSSASPESTSPETPVSYTPTVDDPYGHYEDPYAHDYGQASPPAAVATTPPPKPPALPPPPPPPKDPEDEEEDSMLRMSFLEHLEELRSRIIRALGGLGVAFVASLYFCNDLWIFVQQPAKQALTHLGVNPPNLTQITPMEAFSTIWVKLPMLTSIFLASPWLLYQVWSFIAPGLYKKERRMAAPFVICSAGLFIIGGLFAYFIVFRFGLEFLLGIGHDINITPMVSITEYFDLFVDVMLGVGLVFELPVIIFFLTLLRIASPAFLLNHSRYAILIIVIIAAIVTPTPDVFNLMLFAVPMVLLYFVGVFASYLLVLKREGKGFPWKILFWILGALLVVGGGVIYLLIARYGYKLIHVWPFLTR